MTSIGYDDLPMIGCYQGVELSLDVGLAAMRSGTAAPDACHFRQFVTQNGHAAWPNGASSKGGQHIHLLVWTPEIQFKCT